jgi:hypothetical protein
MLGIALTIRGYDTLPGISDFLQRQDTGVTDPRPRPDQALYDQLSCEEAAHIDRATALAASAGDHFQRLGRHGRAGADYSHRGLLRTGRSD